MKPKSQEWQPLDLIDREAVKPLRSFNSRVAARDHRYYTLNDNSAVCGVSSDSDDEASITSEVEFIDSQEPTPFKESRFKNKYTVILLLAIVMITCLTAGLIWQHVSNKKVENGVCTTPDCVKGSSYILNKMSLDVDPCVDMYTYSCGGWLKNEKLPPSKSKYGAFSKIQDEIYDIMKEIYVNGEGSEYMDVESTAIKKSRELFDMCMDTDDIDKNGKTQILKFIKSLGSWPVTSDPVSGQWNETSWDIQTAVTQSFRTNSKPFMYMTVSPDDRNSSATILVFEQYGLTLDEPREYFSNKSNHAKLREGYLNFTVGIAQLLGADTDVQQKMEKLYDFEQSLAEIFVPHDQLLDPVKNYHKMTLSEFQTNYMGDWLDIVKLVSHLFEKEMDPNMDVLVPTPDYFTRLQELIKKTDKEILATYVVWNNLQPRIGFMPEEFINTAMDLERVEHGVKELDPRWKRCIKKVSSYLGFASGALYVQENFAESSKKEVTFLFDAIRTSFIDNLPSVSWMDQNTKDYAKEKAEAVTNFLGYPDFVKIPAKLDEFYENLTLASGEFFTTSATIGKFYAQKNRLELGKPPDKMKWSMPPTEVNGYYSPSYNHIVFPAGILRPPMFNPTFPRSFNFGSFGMIVGHELTHGFDNTGRNYDKDGNMENWWSNSSQEAFKTRSKCYEDQYSNFSSDSSHLDGKLTLGENIADNGGLKLAYQAYQKDLITNGKEKLVFPGMKFTSDQLFFIGFSQLWCAHYTPEFIKTVVLTDPHSISKFRVLGSVQNSVYFSQAFSCPKQTPMNPEKKCELW